MTTITNNPMRQRPQRNRRAGRPSHRRTGFTLIEVLISFGIFAIGMIAVASLFPVAALLQKETVDDVLGNHAAESAKAIVLAKGLEYDPGNPPAVSELSNYYNPAAPVNNTPGNKAVPLFVVNGTLANKFTVWDRSYPSFNNNIEDRDLFWVPFIQDVQADPTSPVWVMHLFILKRDSRAQWVKDASWANPGDTNPTIPGVRSVGVTGTTNADTTFQLAAAHGIQVGDQILDSNGIAYQVREVTPNSVTINGLILVSPNVPDTVWYAPPGAGGDGNSPTLAIVTFSSDPNDPDAVQLVSDPTP